MARIADIDARQPLNAVREMIIGGGPIDQPPSGSSAVARGVAPAAMILRQVGIFEPHEMKFGVASGREFLIVIGLLKSPALGESDEGHGDDNERALHSDLIEA